MTMTVNGTTIPDEQIEHTMTQMLQQYKQHMQNRPGPEPDDEQVKKWALESIIEQTLLRQQAETDTTPITVDEIHEFYRQAKDNLAQAPLEVAKSEIENRIRVNRVVARMAARRRVELRMVDHFPITPAVLREVRGAHVTAMHHQVRVQRTDRVGILVAAPGQSARRPGDLLSA